MCFDPYILERITATRLNELRAEAAHRMRVDSLTRGRSGVLAAIRMVLLRAARLLGRRGAVRPRHA
jgi:hypothetical protein